MYSLNWTTEALVSLISFEAANWAKATLRPSQASPILRERAGFGYSV
jgi:hypothetical protein